MKLWRKREKSPTATLSLRHDFVIGPPRYNELFGEPSQLYYCVRCKWTFLVGAKEVVVLDERQQRIVGEEGFKRFDSLAGGPCPVLEAFTAMSTTRAARAARRNGLPQEQRRPEPELSVPLPIPASTAHPRPVLHLLGRMPPHFVR